mmetsp:Transcript_67432/g.197177  ORF Transcript_67432/g.197177 Transcript_67432/m.197177 type:complete len:207 (-) Transcript_67432:1591-2211(-)
MAWQIPCAFLMPACLSQQASKGMLLFQHETAAISDASIACWLVRGSCGNRSSAFPDDGMAPAASGSSSIPARNPLPVPAFCCTDSSEHRGDATGSCFGHTERSPRLSAMNCTSRRKCPFSSTLARPRSTGKRSSFSWTSRMQGRLASFARRQARTNGLHVCSKGHGFGHVGNGGSPLAMARFIMLTLKPDMGGVLVAMKAINRPRE